jgi:polyhydroxyalkanoate synthesis repressor PhaR
MLDKANKPAAAKSAAGNGAAAPQASKIDGGAPHPTAEASKATSTPVVVKKYANRRLYNTETSSYVTLDDLATMVRSERDFVVYDAKTGEDLTHAVLTQIIVEQESRMGQETMLPIPFLQQLIRFYGGSMQKIVPSYLQVALSSFSNDQERLSKKFGAALTPAGAIEVFQDQAKKNVALFEQAMTQAMSMFTPFGGASAPGAKPTSPTTETPPTATAGAKPARPEPVRTEAPKATSEVKRDSEFAEMKAQMASMQSMIEKLSKRG